MKANYIYLISQLPMLNFGIRPPFSLEEFIRLSGEFIPEEDLSLLNNLPQPQDYSLLGKINPVLRQWVDFDISLRNELAKIRSARRHIDASSYLRQTALEDSHIAHIAQNVSRNPSPLDAERILDEARWAALDGFEAGHFFDFEILMIYAYKLMILWRWEKIRCADKEEALEEVLV